MRLKKYVTPILDKRRKIMETSSTVNLLLRLTRAKEEQLCPECGARMTQLDRTNENGMIYVWFRCSKDGCTGQWLQKTPETSFTLSTVRHVVGAI
jgi:predicted RNA-binding Zn-ribbon protein involved in translation (DUF1610 family)